MSCNFTGFYQDMTCQQRLSYWAENRGELAPLVLEKPIKSESVNDTNEKVAIAIDDYLKKHISQLDRQDLPILRKLKKKPAPPQICNVVIKAITTITKQKPLQVPELPLISTYLSAEEVINLCVLRQAPSPETITYTFANISFSELEDLALKIFKRFKTDPDTFTAMIEVFLSYAPLRIKMIFFLISGSLEKDNKEVLPFDDFELLDLTEYWTSLQDQDIRNLENYLSVDDAITLCVLNKTPSPEFITQILAKGSPKEIANFAEKVFIKFTSDPVASKLMIREFFSHASLEARTEFLSYLFLQEKRWQSFEDTAYLNALLPYILEIASKSS